MRRRIKQKQRGWRTRQSCMGGQKVNNLAEQEPLGDNWEDREQATILLSFEYVLEYNQSQPLSHTLTHSLTNCLSHTWHILASFKIFSIPVSAGMLQLWSSVILAPWLITGALSFLVIISFVFCYLFVLLNQCSSLLWYIVGMYYVLHTHKSPNSGLSHANTCTKNC